MRVRWWTYGLLAIVVGCNTVDRGYEPPTRGPLGNPSTQVPSGTQPNWQPNETSAFRAPAGKPPVSAPGLLAAGNPPNRLPGGLVGDEGPELGAKPNRTAPLTQSPIRPVIYEERPLKVIDPESHVQPEGPGGRSDLDPEIARRLTPPGAKENPAEIGARRRVMRPSTPTTPDTGSPVPPRSMPDALLMAAPDAPKPLDLTPDKDVNKKPFEVKIPVKEPRKPPEEITPVNQPGETGAEQPENTGAGPSVRMVNTRRIVLNYEIKDIGPSGVSLVELWYTRNGQEWQRDETARVGPPCVTEVPEEGMYGFTLVAKSGLGLGKRPPQRGDLPQAWVEVDLTKPQVSLNDVKHGVGAKAREITITWSASDRNLARRPITLSYAEKSDGPWLPLATNIENSGRYIWNMPENGPASFHIRVEASDLVGNVSSVKSEKPLLIDLARPTVNLLGVEAADR